jgi:uncharacterized protein
MHEKTLVRVLRERCRGVSPVVVALSGGVDSGLAAAAAVRACRDLPDTRVVGVTVHSELTADRDFTRAVEVAEHLGLEHHPLLIRMLDKAGVRGNGPDRCYHCKRAIFSLMRLEYGDHCLIVDGTNSDDDPARPGMRAAEEFSVYHPLAEVGLVKALVRDMARSLGLPNWNAPSESCLATRVAPGLPLSFEALDKVRRMESFLHERGVKTLRARHDNLVATVEYLPEYSEIIEKEREPLLALIKRIGLGSCVFKEWTE